MHLNTLRITASHWHDGQASALYAYCSTGTILPGLAAEIKQCLDLSNGKDYAELARLYSAIAPVPTIADLQNLNLTFWHRCILNSDGTPARCRANGNLKLWKTRPEDFSLPVKYGLKTCFYLNPVTILDWVIAP